MSRELEQKLERCQKEFDDFVYRVSHDLQAPLRTISGFSALLVQGASERLTEREKEELALMADAARQAQALLDSTLRYGRLSRKPCQPVSVDLNQLVREIVDSHHSAFHEGDGRWEIESLPEVHADPAMLEQTLSLLIDNAIKFRSPNRKPIIRITGKKEEGGECSITIEDNGIGIAQKHQPQIFDIFRKLNGDQYKGIGEGLAFVKRLLEMQGGNVVVASVPDEGSKFTITIPCKAA